MVMPESYDRLVDGFSRKLKEAKGNIESKVMTPSETAKEIAEVTEGVFAEGEEGNKGESAMDIVMRATANSGADESKLAAMFPVKKKRGRPKGSKNKPKTDAKA